MEEQDEVDRHRTRRKGEEVKRWPMNFYRGDGVRRLSAGAGVWRRGRCSDICLRDGWELRVDARNVAWSVSVAQRTDVKPKAGQTELEVLLSGGVRLRILYPYYPCLVQTFEVLGSVGVRTQEQVKY